MQLLLKISRLRFWIYIFGPFLVGLAAGARSLTDLISPETIIFGFYFLFPANLLIYGVNDIFDFETDRLNPKKKAYEILLPAERHSWLAKWIIVTNVPFLIYATIVSGPALAALTLFLFFAVFYSSPPIRAKAIPFLDSAFNILYVLPGIFGYALVAGTWPPWRIILAAAFWTAAMHAFSAVPDIEADEWAGLKTVATQSGRNGTIVFCLACYSFSALLVFKYLGAVAVGLGLVYVLLMAVSLFARNSTTLFRIYASFPLVNAIAGFVIFVSAAAENRGLWPAISFPDL